MSGWAPVLGLALVATILSGCVSEGELDVDGLQAPVWEPGFRWTYDVDATGSNTYLTDGGRASSTFEYATGLNTTVINTSGDVNGVPVYFVTQDTDMDDDFYGMELGLFGQGGIVALSQDSLQPVARSSYWHWMESCAPVEMYPVEEPSLLQFPLNLGKTWQGDLDHVTYTAEVVGVEPVKTAAGTFDTVHVRIVLTPEQEPPRVYDSDMPTEYPAESPEGEGYEREVIEEAEFTQDYWYAPAVRNVVKTVTTGHTVFAEGADRYEMTSSTTILLEDYALVPGDEQPAPPIRANPWDTRRGGMQIITDTEFPVNVANGTVTARLGVQERAPPEPMMVESDDGSGPVRVMAMSVPYNDEFLLVDEVPDVGDYDHDLYELVWFLYTWNGEREEIVADVLELEIDAPRYIDVNAQLRSRPVESDGDSSCGFRSMWASMAHGQVHSYFEKEYALSVDAGPAQEIHLDDLPLGDAYTMIVGTWTVDSHAPVVNDLPFPVVYDAEGNWYGPHNAHDGFFEVWTDQEMGANWTLAWRAEGPDTFGGPSPVVVGHDATLHIRIDPQ